MLRVVVGTSTAAEIVLDGANHVIAKNLSALGRCFDVKHTSIHSNIALSSRVQGCP